MQADSAGRALGSLITKMVKNKGFPYNMYSILYQACICSISLYGSEVYGYSKFDSLSNLQHRAIRAFLGMPKNVTTYGLVSEFDWLLPQFMGQIKMIQHFHRLMNTAHDKILYKVYKWDYSLNMTGRITTWVSEVKTILHDHDLGSVFNLQQTFPCKTVVAQLKESMKKSQAEMIKTECEGKPKLRTFMKFKDFDLLPPHIGKPLSFLKRKIISQLRLGILPLRLETARFVRPIIPEDERVCYCGSGDVESECHLLFKCDQYQMLREAWISKLNIPHNFLELPEEDKLRLVLNTPENVRPTARYLVSAIDHRRSLNLTY